jgi:hypothetical protein
MMVGVLGFAFSGKLQSSGTALIPVGVVIVQQVLAVRFFLAEKKRVSLVVLSIIVLQALWYFLPLLAYGLDPDLLSSENIFNDELFVQAGFGMLTLLSAFQLGMVYSLKGSPPREQESPPVRLNQQQSIVLGLLLVAFGLLGLYFKPEFNVDEFEQFLETYNPEYAVAANRASSIAQVSGLLIALAARELILQRRIVPAICALLPLYNILLMAIQNGRRQVLFIVGGMLMYAVLTSARRPLRLLAAAAGVMVILFATVGVFRAGDLTQMPGEEVARTVLAQPVHELAQTSSYHARLLYSQLINGPRYGATYLEGLVYIIPLVKSFVGVPNYTAYYRSVILETVEWADQYYYTMGSTVLSELFANFGVLSPIFALGLGWAAGRLATWMVRAHTNIMGFMFSAFLMSAIIWATRCSLADLYPQSRFIIICIVLTSILGFFGAVSAKPNAFVSRLRALRGPQDGSLLPPKRGHAN